MSQKSQKMSNQQVRENFSPMSQESQKFLQSSTFPKSTSVHLVVLAWDVFCQPITEDPGFSFSLWLVLLSISAHADGGPRSRVRARGTLRSAPHQHERKFSTTCDCRIIFKHLPQPLRSHI